MRKILIITSRYGSGHRTAAEALTQGFKKWQPKCQVSTLDFGEIITKPLDYLTRKSFSLSTTHLPLLHRLFAALTNSDTMLDQATLLSSIISKPRLKRTLLSTKPDIIVSTFPAANRLIAPLKSKHKFSLVTIITDLLTVHRYWIAPQTDAYFIALPEMTSALLAHKVPSSALHVTGFPLRPTFFENKPLTPLYKKHHLKPKPFTVLYLAGTAPDHFAPELAQSLDQIPNLQPIMICGRNKKLYQSLKKKLKNTHLVGFTKNIDEYFRLADILIGKAGPGFLMEAATLGKPVILTNYLEPQEHGNVELVLGRKWGYFEPGVDLILKRVSTLQKLPKTKYQTLTKNALKINPPNSTENIVRLLAQEKF